MWKDCVKRPHGGVLANSPVRSSWQPALSTSYMSYDASGWFRPPATVLPSSDESSQLRPQTLGGEINCPHCALSELLTLRVYEHNEMVALMLLSLGRVLHGNSSWNVTSNPLAPGSVRPTLFSASPFSWIYVRYDLFFLCILIVTYLLLQPSYIGQPGRTHPFSSHTESGLRHSMLFHAFVPLYA